MKRLFSKALSGGMLHFAAHSHHLWPDAALEGHRQAAEDAALLADRKWGRVMGEVLPAVAAGIASELGLPDSDSIAFAPNTHDLFVALFSAWEGRHPTDVLTSDCEFHSFRRQAARWEEAGILKLRVVPAEPFETFTERFVAEARRQAADIIFLSQVQFRTGLRFDGIEALAKLAAADGTWVVIDGYHGFMAMPTDLGAAADRVFYMAGGYKYAMAGEGVCFLHAPPGFGARPAITGWFADFGALDAKADSVGYAEGGARFMGSTFDPSGLYRMLAVQRMLAGEGLDTAAVCAHVAPLRAELEARISDGDMGVLREAELLRPNASGPPARFLALRDPRAGHWAKALADRGVIVDSREDVLRIGLGLYHDRGDLDQLQQMLLALA